MSYQQYQFKILEQSNTKPYIVYIYSNYCQMCYRFHPQWKRVIADLEPLGYGIVTVNGNREQNLMEKMRISHVPALVAIVEGRSIPMRVDQSFSDRLVIIS